MRPSAIVLTAVSLWTVLSLCPALAAENPTFLGEEPPPFRVGDLAQGSVPFETLDEVRGDVVLLVFLRTACPGSRSALKTIRRVREKNDCPDLHVLATTNDRRALVRRFLLHHPQGRQAGFPIACRSEQAWGVRGLPWAFVVGRDGKVAWAGHPARGAARAVEKALAAPEPGMPEAPSVRRALDLRRTRRYARALEAATRAQKSEKTAPFGRWLVDRVRRDYEAEMRVVIARLAAGDVYEAYRLLGDARERFRNTPHETDVLRRLDEMARDEKSRYACEAWKQLWLIAEKAREDPGAAARSSTGRLRCLAHRHEGALAEAALELLHVIETPWTLEDAMRFEEDSRLGDRRDR